MSGSFRLAAILARLLVWWFDTKYGKAIQDLIKGLMNVIQVRVERVSWTLISTRALSHPYGSSAAARNEERHRASKDHVAG